MKMSDTGYIIGAYPCAPLSHQRSEEEEKAFWYLLADTPHIRGLEQSCHESLHPYGDEWLFRHTPGEWVFVVTAIPETMYRRGTNGGFGLASSDEEQRRACIEYHRHLLNKTNAINKRFASKVISLELQAAPQVGNANVAQATEAFARSIKEIASWDWSCSLVLEHCDAMNQPAPRKGFLPLANVLDVIMGYDISVCINWARSAIEGRDVTLPVGHVAAVRRAGKLGALMFSGTAPSGAYGDWQDLHAPFAPGCPESLLTPERVRDTFAAAGPAPLLFSGIKLLEINASADVNHRIAILRDGIQAMNISL